MNQIPGRLDFYNQYGVIRDVMQNHLTELLTLVAMDLPKALSSQDVSTKRMAILQHVQPLTSKQMLIGQYSRYIKDAQEENVTMEASAYTPTFAAAVLYIDSLRWNNVPFVIMSGKHLYQRSSYIRIIFKDNEFCVSSCSNKNGSHFNGAKQIIFQIGHGNLPSAGILVSKNLFIPNLPEGLKTMIVTSHDSSVYGKNIDDYNFAVPTENSDAYVSLIQDLYSGNQQSFVSTERLKRLWEIWTPILKEEEKLPRLYAEGLDLSLNFRITNRGIEFKDKYETVVKQEADKYTPVISIPHSFIGQKLIVEDTEKLYQSLADQIYSIAQRLIQEKGTFHIAFSGGNTPVKLFRIFVSQFPEFPWKWTHIWQVDERCVHPDDPKSNFRLIQSELLHFIKIPYHNIHPMPVFLAGKVCYSESTNIYYEDLLFHFSNNSSFDVIILGVGTDGHTASLFPGSSLLDEMTTTVSLTSTEASPRRLTLLYPMINKSKNIFAIVTGKAKHNIVDELSDKDLTMRHKYPILGVTPDYGNMTIYIDNEAWFGD